MNIADLISGNSPEKVLDAYYEAKNKPRNRLGLSQIGKACHRSLWYAYQGYEAKPIDGKTLRLFELGNIIEDHIVQDLRACGYSIAGLQQEVSIEHNGIKLFGHIDGLISELIESTQIHLLEIKTANDKSFNELKKKGYQAWKPEYKAQIHAYMVILKLKRCLVVVYNKNNSEIYTERINLDKDYITGLLIDVFNSIASKIPPPRTCNNETIFEAKFCNYKSICFGKE